MKVFRDYWVMVGSTLFFPECINAQSSAKIFCACYIAEVQY